MLTEAYLMQQVSERLIGNATRAARRAADTEHGPKRTEALLALAERLFAIREAIVDADGVPDWRGRTHAYRQTVNEVFSRAGIREKERATLQQAVRYHLSNLIRTHLSEEELADLNLRPVGARERAQEVRASRSALVEVARAQERGETIQALRALAACQALLSRVSLDVRELTAAERAAGLALAEKVAEAATLIRNALAHAG